MAKQLTKMLVILFTVFLLLFHFPLITLADTPSYVNGIPVFFIYLFSIWLVLICAIYFTVKKTGDNHGH